MEFESIGSRSIQADSRSAVGRVLNYLSFAVSAAVLGIFLVRRADVAYVYHPPPTVGLAAVVLKWFRGIPFVYDVQDLWPDTLAATGMIDSKIARYVISIWCRFVYRRAAHVVVLSPGFKQIIENRVKSPPPVQVIYNWCDESNIHPMPRDEKLAQELGINGYFVVLFAGNMGKAQALETMLGAASLLLTSHPRVRFVLIGGGTEVERLKEVASSLGLSNVVFLERRPYSQIAPVLMIADLLLVHLRDDPRLSDHGPFEIRGLPCGWPPNPRSDSRRR